MLLIAIMSSVHDAELAGLDLNALVVLDALLDERHVTRAASRLGRTQSAVSHALAKLREAFGDPLLVRSASGLVLTARAEAIAPALRRALDGVKQAIRGEPRFDATTARRTFRIATVDYAELILLPRLAARLAIDAPGIDLWVVPVPDGDLGPALAAADVDLALGVWSAPAWPAGFYQRRLFDEDFRCVVRTGHPAAAQRLTLARFCELNHLLVAPRGTPGSRVDDRLAELGRTRRIAVRVPHFLIAPHVVAASDLVATIPSRLARLYAEAVGLELLAPPFEMTGFTIAMAWHERLHQDPGHRWLRERLVEAAAI